MITGCMYVCLLYLIFLQFYIYRNINSGKKKPSVGSLTTVLKLVGLKFSEVGMYILENSAQILVVRESPSASDLFISSPFIPKVPILIGEFIKARALLPLLPTVIFKPVQPFPLCVRAITWIDKGDIIAILG